MNNVQLIGRLTKDVDLRYAQGQNGQLAIARFTVAVDRPRKQDGSHDTDFITCFSMGARAETISRYFQKGSKIGLTGAIRTGSYVNQQGVTVYTTEVEVRDIDFIDPKNTQQPNATTPEYNMQQGQVYYQNAPQAAPVNVRPQQAAAPAQQQRKPAGKKAAPQQATQPQQVPNPVQAQGGWVDLDQVQDEGLPFN